MYSRSRKVIAFLSGLLFVCGCSHPVGLLYTTVQSAENATPQPRGTKEGSACAHSILGLIAFGDHSVDRARHNGRITKIVSVDRNSFLFLGGLYGSECTLVRGR